jgi:hypothetical protein
MATHAATPLQHHLDLLLDALLCGGLLLVVLLTGAALPVTLLLRLPHDGLVLCVCVMVRKQIRERGWRGHGWARENTVG